MSGTSKPQVKTYEEYVAYLAKDDETAKRYFFHQILYAQKERERLRGKNRRGYAKRKARHENSAVIPAEFKGEAIVEN